MAKKHKFYGRKSPEPSMITKIVKGKGGSKGELVIRAIDLASKKRIVKEPILPGDRIVIRGGGVVAKWLRARASMLHPEIRLVIDAGDASKEDVARVLSALSDLCRSHIGSGLEFVPSEGELVAKEAAQ